MFPARWSHGNPVDPAGDRDFIQYLRAPEMLLQCPEVDAIIFMGFGSFSGMSSVFASDVEDSSYSGYLDGLSGFQEMAKQIVTVLDSGDEKQIKVTIVQLIQVFFDAMMPKKATEIEEFLETVSNALTTAEMLRSQFFTNLARFFNILAVGDFKSVEISDILDLIEPMIGAYVNGLIAKYNKPVITTTFTEENTRMSETGHFPFPNSDRASTVLAKMVEYREYLERNSWPVPVGQIKWIRCYLQNRKTLQGILNGFPIRCFQTACQLRMGLSRIRKTHVVLNHHPFASWSEIVLLISQSETNLICSIKYSTVMDKKTDII